MQALEDTGVFAYAAGEEVVAVIKDAEVLDIERGLIVAQAALPPWVIGNVVACVRRGGAAAYVLRYRYDGRAHVCVVEANAIEGAA